MEKQEKIDTENVQYKVQMKPEIKLYKCQTFSRMNSVDLSNAYYDFYDVLKKHKFDEYTKYPIHVLLDFIEKMFEELPIFESKFDELNREFNCNVEKIEIK